MWEGRRAKVGVGEGVEIVGELAIRGKGVMG